MNKIKTNKPAAEKKAISNKPISKITQAEQSNPAYVNLLREYTRLMSVDYSNYDCKELKEYEKGLWNLYDSFGKAGIHDDRSLEVLQLKGAIFEMRNAKEDKEFDKRKKQVLKVFAFKKKWLIETFFPEIAPGKLSTWMYKKIDKDIEFIFKDRKGNVLHKEILTPAKKRTGKYKIMKYFTADWSLAPEFIL